jgi:hypothetical protein
VLLARQGKSPHHPICAQRLPAKRQAIAVRANLHTIAFANAYDEPKNGRATTTQSKRRQGAIERSRRERERERKKKQARRMVREPEPARRQEPKGLAPPGPVILSLPLTFTFLSWPPHSFHPFTLSDTPLYLKPRPGAPAAPSSRTSTSAMAQLY